MPFVEDAMDRVKLHYDAERRILMETVDPEQGIDHSTMAGRLFNPGHSVEVAWFLLHLCKLKPSQEHTTMASGALRQRWPRTCCTQRPPKT
jgi:N-acylglucosamine 2-epimerase